jgi:hypothetical protein
MVQEVGGFETERKRGKTVLFKDDGSRQYRFKAVGRLFAYHSAKRAQCLGSGIVRECVEESLNC